MKPLFVVIMFSMCAFGGALFSSLITITVWGIQIEPREFQCTDGITGWPFDSYWTAMADHRSAGDSLSVGWTWDMLENVREIYIASFYMLWMVSTLIPFRLILRMNRRPKTALEPAPTAACE